MGQDLIWKFDKVVAETFVDHARQHIPNYDSIIEKTVDVCKHLLSPDQKIIDIGCATGQTLRQLQSAGFTNLVGVDASADMLALCDVDAKLIYSETLPTDTYSAVISNWTLHFIKNKEAYLADIYRSLDTGGFLFLTDKTSKDPLAIHFYHNYKRSNGVSEHEIQQKAESVESIMYINDPGWYLKTLADLGFKTVQIADANWCFTSFIAVK
jgi:tRNA (cmo5U34)-methyltransferase